MSTLVRGTGPRARVLSGGLCLPLASASLPALQSQGVGQSTPSQVVSPMPGGPKTADPDRLKWQQTRSIEQYRRHCINCHEADGRGESSRDLMASIPDFTRPEWQAAHDVDCMLHTIREGKGSMPAMKARLGPGDAVLLVSLVRNFRGGGQVVPDGPDEHEGPSTPPESQEATEPPGPDPRPARAVPRIASDSAVPGSETGRSIFQRFCLSCHGADGHGSEMRALTPRPQDFASPDWQSKRCDPQLTASILEGRGAAMPSFGSRLSEAQAREVLAYVRSFASTEPRVSPKPSKDFRRRFEELRGDLERLDRQYRALSRQ
jgi:mono/diheme cytochrome c family protein